MQDKIDHKIMNTLGAGLDFSNKSGGNLISDLDDIICRMTTVIVCSENDKERLEKHGLPSMTKIIPNKYLDLEEGTVYLVEDENAKRAMLGMGTKFDLSDFPVGKENEWKN